MQLLTKISLEHLMLKGDCPHCGRAWLPDGIEMFFSTKHINYVKCNMCLKTFKFRKRKMKNLQDKYIFEISGYENEIQYAVRGFHINKETYENNSIKNNLKKHYTSFFISEEDDFIITQ